MKRNANIYDIIIIGGGAGGLFCASEIKRRNPSLSVAILEKQKSIGKKLLATGNGRCNITNVNAKAEHYHGSLKDSAADILKTFSPQNLIDNLRDKGLLTTCDSEGRVYPLSKHSSTVLDVFSMYIASRNVDVFCESFVNDISIDDDIFTVNTNNAAFYAKKIIISTGSKATPETGANDSIFSTLSKLGHKITDLSPSLCPVFVKSKTLFMLKGVRVNGKVSILHNGKILKSESGEIQFTEKTISGICVFNLSRIANSFKSTSLSLSLLPDLSKEEISKLLFSKKESLSADSPCENLLCGIFQRKLSSALLKEVNIKKDAAIKEISAKDIEKLTALINDWRFEIIPSSDFTRAQVVAGGIAASEIDHITFESKRVKNLYIIGEALDVDGDCGGLNLHFAFGSAYCAAQDIVK